MVKTICVKNCSLIVAAIIQPPTHLAQVSTSGGSTKASPATGCPRFLVFGERLLACIVNPAQLRLGGGGGAAEGAPPVRVPHVAPAPQGHQLLRQRPLAGREGHRIRRPRGEVVVHNGMELRLQRGRVVALLVQEAERPAQEERQLRDEVPAAEVRHARIRARVAQGRRRRCLPALLDRARRRLHARLLGLVHEEVCCRVILSRKAS
mmetsp:Transcript_21800/g.37490  ORF Transcript_21800/g.37490 Transcript_21800/m.37490 type:complete len:207 (+) Transcript_21800:303-923(+)